MNTFGQYVMRKLEENSNFNIFDLTYFKWQEFFQNGYNKQADTLMVFLFYFIFILSRNYFSVNFVQ